MTTLSDIFHSSGHSLRNVDYGDIAEQIEKNLIAIRAARIDPSTPSMVAARSDLWEQAEMIGVGGGIRHSALAVIATAYLIDQGYTVEHEQWANGRRVDVMTTCRTWFIECGDTNGAPIVQHLDPSSPVSCRHFAVLPFDTLTLLKEGKEPILYVFEQGENFSQYDKNAWMRDLPQDWIPNLLE